MVDYAPDFYMALLLQRTKMIVLMQYDDDWMKAIPIWDRVLKRGEIELYHKIRDIEKKLMILTHLYANVEYGYYKGNLKDFHNHNNHLSEKEILKLFVKISCALWVPIDLISVRANISREECIDIFTEGKPNSFKNRRRRIPKLFIRHMMKNKLGYLLDDNPFKNIDNALDKCISVYGSKVK